jgi:hypothetical protein
MQPTTELTCTNRSTQERIQHLQSSTALNTLQSRSVYINVADSQPTPPQVTEHLYLFYVQPGHLYGKVSCCRQQRSRQYAKMTNTKQVSEITLLYDGF